MIVKVIQKSFKDRLGHKSKLSNDQVWKMFLEWYKNTNGESELIQRMLKIEEKPFIKAAAILIKGVIHTLPRPARYDTIIKKIFKETKEPVRGEQGFINDKGEFVNKIDAAKIVIDAKQIEYLKWPPQLYSEDLW
jgi:hypothetical protein